MTPPLVAEKLAAAGWTKSSAVDCWVRPGSGDRHSWPVAELIERDQETRVPPPPKPPRRPPKPGFQMRGSNYGARRAKAKPKPEVLRAAHRPLGKHELAARIVKMRDEGQMTWKAIAAVVGGVQGRSMYLYKRYREFLAGQGGT